MIRKEGSQYVALHCSSVQQVLYRVQSVSTLRTSLLPKLCSAQLFTFTFVIAVLLILLPPVEEPALKRREVQSYFHSQRYLVFFLSQLSFAASYEVTAVCWNEVTAESVELGVAGTEVQNIL